MQAGFSNSPEPNLREDWQETLKSTDNRGQSQGHYFKVPAPNYNLISTTSHISGEQNWDEGDSFKRNRPPTSSEFLFPIRLAE